VIFILSPVDSLNFVRTFQLQEKEQALKEKGQVFGQSCTGLLAKYDQNTHSLKMFQLSLFEEEPESLETLPKSGMTVNGKLWEQTMWAHPTVERGSGLWLTPSTVQIEPTEGRREKRQAFRKSIGRKDNPGCLAEQVAMWPTPSVMDSTGRGQRAFNKGNWATQSLEYQVNHVEKMWPTPRTSEWKDVGPVGSKSHTHMDKRDYLCAKVKDPEQPTGSLNPQWVEWLMGYPIGWTDLKD